MTQGFHHRGEEKSFVRNRLTITRDPLIKGAMFYTIGPKRAYRLWRLHNGVSILLDPVNKDQPFGWIVMEGLMTESIVILPIQCTLCFVPPLD